MSENSASQTVPNRTEVRVLLIHVNAPLTIVPPTLAPINIHFWTPKFMFLMGGCFALVLCLHVSPDRTGLVALVVWGWVWGRSGPRPWCPRVRQLDPHTCPPNKRLRSRLVSTDSRGPQALTKAKGQIFDYTVSQESAPKHLCINFGHGNPEINLLGGILDGGLTLNPIHGTWG